MVTWPIMARTTTTDMARVKRASTDQEETEIQSQSEFKFRKTKVLFEGKLVAGKGSPELKEKPFNIDVERFKSFTKLCRATAWVIRFIERPKKRTNLSGPLKSTEISKAEIMWTAYVQHTEYSNVIDSISKEKSNNRRTQLGLYIDNNGLIRCKGRLENAEICEGSRYHLPLPKYHRYTDLVIQYDHERAFHTGCAQTLSLIRQKFWILQGRAAVNRVLKRCAVCVVMKGDHIRYHLYHLFLLRECQHQHYLPMSESTIWSHFS